MTPVLQPPPVVTVAPAARVRSRSTVAPIPPPPGPGLVPLVFDADPARGLIVTRLLQTVRARGQRGFETIEVQGSSYGLVCVAPCATWVVPGAMRFGVGPREDSRWFTRVLQIDRPSTLEIRYVDNAMLRLAGAIAILGSLTIAGLATFDAFDGGELLTPLIVGSTAIVGVFVGLGFALAGDGVDLRLHSSIAGWR